MEDRGIIGGDRRGGGREGGRFPKSERGDLGVASFRQEPPKFRFERVLRGVHGIADSQAELRGDRRAERDEMSRRPSLRLPPGSDAEEDESPPPVGPEQR